MGINNKKLCIQITDSSINILIGNRNRIYEANSIALESGICFNGSIADIDALAKKLNEYLEVNARDVKKVSFVLSSSHIITRYIELPILKEDALREAVHFEFSQFIPEIDEYYMNYEIVERINTKDKKAYKIVLVAVKKERINTLVEISNKIGKELDIIDTLSNSLSRILKCSNYLVSEESTGIIYLGADCSVLSVIEAKALKFEKNLPYGVNNIFDEAYEEITATAVNTRSIDKILDSFPKVKISFEGLLSNINNIIRFYNSDRNNRDISNLVIVSVNNYIEGIERYFEKYFELPCIAINNPSDLNLKIKFEENFANYIPCYGLLLRENNKNLLNLNPKVINKEENKENLDKALVRSTAIVILVMLVSSIPLFVINKIITKDIAVLQSNIDKYSEIVQKNTELKANNANMENFINRIEGVDENTAHTSEIIEKLNSYVPKEITFNAMSFSDSGNISISGEATTYYSIPEFLANLQMSELFSNAKISNITPIERFLSSSNTRNVSEANESNITDDDISIANAEKEARNIVSGTVATNYGKGTSSEEQISSGSYTSNEQSITSSNNNGNSNAISTVNSNIITTYSFSISIEGVSKDGTGNK